MGKFGITELLVILAILLLLFGTKRLRTLGSDLGTAIKGFRKSMTEEDSAPEPPAGHKPDSEAPAEKDQ